MATSKSLIRLGMLFAQLKLFLNISQNLVDVENSFRLFKIRVQHGVSDPSVVASLQQLQQGVLGRTENLPFSAEICGLLEQRGGIPGQKEGERLLPILELPERTLHLIVLDSIDDIGLDFVTHVDLLSPMSLSAFVERR